MIVEVMTISMHHQMSTINLLVILMFPVDLMFLPPVDVFDSIVMWTTLGENNWFACFYLIPLLHDVVHYLYNNYKLNT